MTLISTLIVARPRGSWTGRLSACAVIVDGAVKGEIRPGAELALALPPGAHTVQARLGHDHGPDTPVHLGPGATVRLRVESHDGEPTLVPAD